MRAFTLSLLLALPLLSTALSTYDLANLFTISIDESNTSGAPYLAVSSAANPDVVVMESLSSSSLFEVENGSKGLKGSSVPPFLALGTSKVTKGPIEEVSSEPSSFSAPDYTAMSRLSATQNSHELLSSPRTAL